MRLYEIIPYWVNVGNGETRQNELWSFLIVGNTYDEVYNWAKDNTELFHFKFDNVFKPSEINGSNLKFDFSVKECDDMIVRDPSGTEYRVLLQIYSKIETKRIETVLEEKSKENKI